MRVLCKPPRHSAASLPRLSRDRLPLLITGISGVAGYNALSYFSARYPGQVIGIRQRDNWRLTGPEVVACDAEDRDTLARLFDEYEFKTVLDCAGNCALKSCELDPGMARRINVVGVETLLDVLGSHDVRLAHLSIDLVFSGNGNGGHVETDATDPVTVYGKTMVEAEELLLRERPAASILRISLPMGVSFNGHAGAIDWIQSRFKQNKPATLYFDEVRTPTYTDCLNPLFDEVLSRDDLPGLFHAGGPRRLTPVSDRADRESRRRLRSRAFARLPSPRRGADPATCRQCDDGFVEIDRRAGARSVRRLAAGRRDGANASRVALRARRLVARFARLVGRNALRESAPPPMRGLGLPTDS